MGFLNNQIITVDAILTRKGRELLAKNDGSFRITQFALSDDEIDYTLYNPTHPSGSAYYGQAIDGMPLLEAFASGLPVIASRINAHVEIADDAATYADPKNAKDIAKKIGKLVTDQKLRDKMINKGFRKVKEYSWEKTVEETYQVYKRAVSHS